MSTSNITYEKHCEYCKIKFVAQKISTRFCSLKCANLANKKRKRIGEVSAVIEKDKLHILDEIQKRDYLKVSEVAVLFGCATRTIYSMIERGVLKSSRLSSRMTIVKRTDIDLMLNRSQNQPLIIKPSEIIDFYKIEEIKSKYNIQDRRIFQIINHGKIPTIKKGLYRYVSKKHFDIYYTNHQLKKSLNDEVEYYSIAEIRSKYFLTLDQAYYYIKYHNIEKIKKGKCIYVNKLQFDTIFNRRMISAEFADFAINSSFVFPSIIKASL